ncbi:unnamed protein product [Macrosiphum euphorbiae]|nr:unnamed protein product [Macrosiphum euphorbiae]
MVKARSPRSIWMKSWLSDKTKFGHLPLISELRNNNPEDFKNYLRIDGTTFDFLLDLIGPLIQKEDTIMRESIPPEQRLLATLTFLATGMSYQRLKFSTAISASSLCEIIPETCDAIFKVLKKDYLTFPKNKNEWQSISKGFKDQWQVINCGGALDGKHVRIIPPKDSGAHFYNYKGFYSMVLMALVNSNYEFIYVDIGKNGRCSDGGVIEHTTFYKKLLAGTLDLPNNYETEENLNFSFLADDAFALHNHVLKPYPGSGVTHEERIFNYRLARGRNVVENAFGLLTSRFRVLHTAINMSPDNIKKVVLAICALHNFLRKTSNSYASNKTFDKEDTNTHEIINNGDWRNEAADITEIQKLVQRNAHSDAKINRNNYKQFYNEKGKVDWQEEMLQKGKA